MKYQKKLIQKEKTISDLNTKFADIVCPLGKNNTRGTKLYEYQVEFVYLINEIHHAPPQTISKKTAAAYNFLQEIKNELSPKTTDN